MILSAVLLHLDKAGTRIAGVIRRDQPLGLELAA